MVDFKELLSRRELPRIIDPIVLFQKLDKKSGKEFLRPSQEAILKEWNRNFRTQKDTIIKLHTGHGKTLIGLLTLQASLNEGLGPALYVCPNNYLVDQTITQAEAFGISTVQFAQGKSTFPREFLNSEKILVTNCKKLFNGRSVFGVVGSSRERIRIGSIVIDDAHKCLEIIRDSFSIKLRNEMECYKEIFNIFSESLIRQEHGTYLDLESGNDDSLLAVPFWSWYDKKDDIIQKLKEHKDDSDDYPDLFFTWDLIKNRLEYCTCIISGQRIEITPRVLPIDLIPSFSDATRRIFLSATLTDDAFLIKDLGIEPESVRNPLSLSDIKYSGERLILIPSLIDVDLGRERVIGWLSQFTSKCGNFGVAAIVPSFHHAQSWPNCLLTDVNKLKACLNDLRQNVENKCANKVVVLVNEYDGVDLPDNVCRILCLDSLPRYTSLLDRYEQLVRGETSVMHRKMAQIVEQGIGRSIRGPSDWSIVLMIGNNLTNFLSENVKRLDFSNEAQKQIEIGEELAQLMRDEGDPIKSIEAVIKQCLDRNLAWKEYYREKMSTVEIRPVSEDYIEKFKTEREAETNFQQGNLPKSLDLLNTLIHENRLNPKEMGWYLQLKAIYLYPTDRSGSMNALIRAHSENSSLFRPESGLIYSKLLPNTKNQAYQLLEWVKEHESYASLVVDVRNRLDDITFSVSSEIFERGMKNLGQMLGFNTQRPDKEHGVGPDNLWQIGNQTFWLIECKNEVSRDRGISRDETEQMNTAIEWFKRNYESCHYTPVFLHPSNYLMNNAFESEPFWVIKPEHLKYFTQLVHTFYVSLKNYSFEDLSVDIINQKLAESNLSKEQLNAFLERVQRSN